MLYPLKFEPILKEKIWGGQYFHNTFAKGDSSTAKVGESWELSTVGDDISIVANGKYAGTPLNEIISKYKAQLVGQKNYDKFNDEFPILIKLIDAQDNLSVQVHPDEAAAQRKHKKHGKTEMWYVFDPQAGAKFIAGLDYTSSKAAFAQSIKEGTTERLLRKDVSVPGDVFFIPAGRIHAIGGGNVIMEVQQTSDVTYRVYDYMRKDDEGNYRELHVDDALEVSDFEAQTNYKTPYALVKNQTKELVSSPYFTTNKVLIDQTIEKDYSGLDSFVVLFSVDGDFLLECSSQTIEVKKGELILVPAEINNCTLKPLGSASQILEVYV